MCRTRLLPYKTGFRRTMSILRSAAASFRKNRTIFTKRSIKQNENFYHKSAVSESAVIDEKDIVGYNNSNNRIAEKWRMVKWKTVLLQILA